MPAFDPRPLVEPLVDAGTPFARAVLAALASEELGPAFLAGYRAAVARLVPSLGDTPAALAATEQGPVHPRSIRTSIAEDGRITGLKRFVTGVPGAERAVVLAVAGEDGERRRLVAAVVDLRGPGVVLKEMPAMPGIEVPHAELELRDAPGERLPGDGWADVVRPFRTVEDVHALGAILGWLLAVAGRAGWPRDTVAALCGSLATLSGLAGRDPSAVGTHLALAGALAAMRGVVEVLPWSDADPGDAERWERGSWLLGVAQRAREARLASAWQRATGG